MKKIVNNPKLLVIISIILLVISFISTLSIYNIVGNFLDFTTSGCLVLLLYFILIISKKHINLKVLNTILLINYLLVFGCKLFYLIAMFIDYNKIVIGSLPVSFIVIRTFITHLPLFGCLIVFLGIIFYSKNKSLIKPNIMTAICLLIYVICIVCSVMNVSTYGITKFEVAIRCIIETLYYIPIILYFRLYTLNKLEKMEVKNER